MKYFDENKIIDLTNIPENEIPVIMITYSKIKCYRKPSN